LPSSRGSAFGRSGSMKDHWASVSFITRVDQKTDSMSIPRRFPIYCRDVTHQAFLR
jgi:hypothetical protein